MCQFKASEAGEVALAERPVRTRIFRSLIIFTLKIAAGTHLTLRMISHLYSHGMTAPCKPKTAQPSLLRTELYNLYFTHNSWQWHFPSFNTGLCALA